ncbi:lysin B [Gordonia phage AnarQue]|nr:lysin B [Gordonia phage AnarQue]
MIDLFWLDGTFTGPGSRSVASEAVRAALDPRVFEFHYVEYPAAFGPATRPGDPSMASSALDGAVAMREAVAATDRLAVVGGYSQGAIAARWFLDDLPAWPELEVLGYGSIGDPHTARHSGRSGISGPRGLSVPGNVVWAPGDPIADLLDGSPLRTVADVTDYMSIRSIEDAAVWANDVWQDLTDQRVQAWWQPWRWNGLADALGAITRYWPGTNHTTDYQKGGWSALLAARLNERYAGVA